MQLCTTSSVTICPAKVPLYHSQLLTAKGVYSFRTRIVTNCAVRTCCDTTRIRLVYITGRSGRTTSRNSAKSPYVALRKMAGPHAPCNSGGSGLIHNASACHIASQEIRTLPVLSKTAELPLDAPQLFLPDRVPAVASHELAKIEAAMSPETSGLDYVKERLVTPRQAFDVDTLLHVHQKSVHAAQESHWLRLTTMIACSITIILLLFFSLRSYVRILFLRCWHVKADPSPIAAPRVTPVPDAILEHVETGTRKLGPQEPVMFTTYALQDAQH